jgi:hypothetical protein
VKPAAERAPAPGDPGPVLSSADQPSPGADLKAPGLLPPAKHPPQAFAGPFAIPVSTLEFLAVLQQHPHPDHREWAVEQLGLSSDAARHPDVVQALLTKAVSDPAPLVRVACLSTIRKLRILDCRVSDVIHQLNGDRDPRVKLSAGQLDHWLREQINTPGPLPRS